jgi:hypothetical protein
MLHCLDCGGYFSKRDDESLMVHLLDYVIRAELARSECYSGYDVQKKKQLRLLAREFWGHQKVKSNNGGY